MGEVDFGGIVDEAGWPPRTDWEERGKSEKAAKQAKVLAEERARVPGPKKPRVFGGGSDCDLCGSQLTELKLWHETRNTLRCHRCLAFFQDPSRPKDPDWAKVYQASEWPLRTNWEARGSPRVAAYQAAIVERESGRVPDTSGARAIWWKHSRCMTKYGGCGRRGVVRLKHWRSGYATRRCRYCLGWTQVIQHALGGGHGGYSE